MLPSLLSTVEQKRLHISRTTAAQKKSQLGQFLTPASTAIFMASLFPDAQGDCRLLDAGAGIGSLAAAFLERWRFGDFQFPHVGLDAFEIDPSLHPYLEHTLGKYTQSGRLHVKIHDEDFIHAAAKSFAGSLFAQPLERYTHIILNPPYKKINSKSAHRLALRRVGIETVNLYSAFVALAVALAAPGGQIVAIIPRSFCNGPYYRSFRTFLFERTAIRHIHLFASRNKTFQDDKVLQENIIIRLERGAAQETVRVSTSTDDNFNDLVFHEYPFERIVFTGDDAERFIHIPTSPENDTVACSPLLACQFADLDIKVSTGPVVDFRLKEHLRAMPESGTVPLLYPCHCGNSGITWPIKDTKKPNAIERNAHTEKYLYPKGFYCVVRRFSSKEEKRRIVATVVNPGTLGDCPMLGFENHLNVFHEHKHGLPEKLAHGLAVFLNSTSVDQDFRCFNGHTQVNATDLKLMHYPNREALMDLGAWAMRQERLNQTIIDNKLTDLTQTTTRT